MSFLEVLSAVLIGPLKLLFEVVYVIACKLIGDFGLSIIALSLIMNFLVLPLYRRADAMQEEARDTENKLHKGVAHIKKAFSGDEQMMILQTYYRQNDYRPTDALRGSVSLLLEIPFFIAAYQFLSHLELLNGVSFGPIADLSAPDGLLTLGGATINLLPILMTLINVISSALFLKGHPLKTKIQLYAMALFFLVFLYTSPSGLVFYWTLNNLFSLCKTIFYKLKNPKKVAAVLAAICGLVAVLFSIFLYPNGGIKLRAAFICAGIALQYPLLTLKRNKKPKVQVSDELIVRSNRLFGVSAVFLTALIGALIPSTFICASPQEFIDLTNYSNPLWHVAYSLFMTAGAFLVWAGVFYSLASRKGKVVFARVMCVMCVVALVDYMFFGTNLGNLSSTLQYDNGLSFTKAEVLLNLAVVVVAAVAVCIASAKFTKKLAAWLPVGALVLICMTSVNVYEALEPIASAKNSSFTVEVGMPKYELSTEGKNVIVLMLDRALGELVPYMLEEDPELARQFDGFTYYANTISFGLGTNFASPALFGGYEYTPVELNKRESESLAEKHNEALKVLPVLFSENGYDVTVCDPTYAGYQTIPDLSIYDDYPGIEAYITKSGFERQNANSTIQDTRRNLFCFSVMKTLPVCLQNVLYAGGNYNHAVSNGAALNQTVYDRSTAEGTNIEAMVCYNVLDNLPEKSVITNKDKNTALMMTNELTHTAMLFQKPEYTPADYVDNSGYDNVRPMVINGRELHLETSDNMQHYHVNMAAFQRLGEWFDFMRENGVYDNTRIIIASDHGFRFDLLDGMRFDEMLDCTAERFFPLLMVKDFDSTGFETSYDFMTNADVATFATSGIIENPINPFTGKAINSNEKTAHDQMVILDYHDITVNNGNTFCPSYWASIRDNLWDMDAWKVSTEEIVLKEHALP